MKRYGFRLLRVLVLGPVYLGVAGVSWLLTNGDTQDAREWLSELWHGVPQ